MHRTPLCRMVVLLTLLTPSLVSAQGALARGALTGTVRDASGAVLPGVTVEVATHTPRQAASAHAAPR